MHSVLAAAGAMEVPQDIEKDDSSPSEFERPIHHGSPSGIEATYEKLVSSTAAISAVEAADPLKKIRGRLLRARRAGADSATIQAEIDQLISQLDSTVNPADINLSATCGGGIGSLRSRLKIQCEFTKALSDALGRGTGSVVDVTVEEEAARLGTLQRQQALSIQSLPSANQTSQSILAVFR
jgi:flagellin-like hook-associated protein FlgL